MNWEGLAVGAVVLLSAGISGAFIADLGPLENGSSQGAESLTETADSNTADSDTTGSPPFAFAVDSIEECGQTCRDVTSTLTNQQNSVAEDVTVSTRIYAGNSTDGDAVWDGSEGVGTLEAGRSSTTTRRVDLSFGDAYAIEQEGGWITVRTTVETTDRAVTFTDQRQVA